jgi:hypothetical protein
MITRHARIQPTRLERDYERRITMAPVLVAQSDRAVQKVLMEYAAVICVTA